MYVKDTLCIPIDMTQCLQINSVFTAGGIHWRNVSVRLLSWQFCVVVVTIIVHTFRKLCLATSVD